MKHVLSYVGYMALDCRTASGVWKSKINLRTKQVGRQQLSHKILIASEPVGWCGDSSIADNQTGIWSQGVLKLRSCLRNIHEIEALSFVTCSWFSGFCPSNALCINLNISRT